MGVLQVVTRRSRGTGLWHQSKVEFSLCKDRLSDSSVWRDVQCLPFAELHSFSPAATSSQF